MDNDAIEAAAVAYAHSLKRGSLARMREAVAAYEGALWRSMDSAPRDGTPILVLCCEEPGIIIIHCIGAIHGKTCWYTDRGGPYTNDRFSHWRPLPKWPEVMP